MSKARTAILPAIVSIFTVACGGVALACSTHGTGAEKVNFQTTGASGKTVRGLLTLETFLVPPSSPTTCTAGIGLGSLTNPLPPGVKVLAMAIVVVNAATGGTRPLTAFSLAPNTTTSDCLAAGSGSSSVPNTNPLFEGSRWFGFSSPVQPFAPPVLRPGEFTAFQFTLEADRALLPLVLDVQFAGGQGGSNGKPTFDGPHPAQYFTADNQCVAVTEPAVGAPAYSPGSTALLVGALMGLGLRGATRRRRRAGASPPVARTARHATGQKGRRAGSWRARRSTEDVRSSRGFASLGRVGRKPFAFL
jgi:hypothetical protein